MGVGGMDVRVVLIEPLYEMNIGYVARGMKNFGLRELYIVRPQTEIGVTARMMAMHAQDILDSMTVVETLDKALDGIDYVIGTTGKTVPKGIRAAITIHEFYDLLVHSEIKGKLALLFGREDYGLTNDVLRRCDIVVTIPANPEYPVLNLSHAAIIFFYELYNVRRRKARLLKRASGEAKERLMRYFAELLEEINYPVHKRERSLLVFRRLIGRSFASEREVTVLYGVFRRTIKVIRASKQERL